MAHAISAWLLAVVCGLLVCTVAAQDTWCGKVYNGSAQIIPGGFLTQPEASSTPLLDVQVTTRHSIYVGSETTGEVIVDAVVNSYHGSPYVGSTSAGGDAPDAFSFTCAIQGKPIGSGSIGLNTTDNLFQFNLSQLTPSMTAYPLTLTGSTGTGNYSAASELFYLPEKTSGSVVKIDRLYGSILYRNNNTGGVFKPYFPYGYYGSYSDYFNTTGNPTAYADAGFNALNPVSDFTDGDMTYTLDEMDGLDLLFQYDMRNSYQNLSSVAQQVPLVRDHPSLLSWYTADEPDGWGYTFNSTTDAYDLLAAADKYHPTSLVLNCQNYYFAEYTAGTDIIMEDAYPVGINTTYSTKWATPVNLTYGDCGCDNCAGGSANLLNVPRRVEDFKKYAAWVGGSALTRKPIWAVPQAFSGEQYWSRDPTAQETWVMDLLAFNHGAKGRLAWIYPPSAALGNATSQLARVATTPPVVDFLTGANPVLVSDSLAGGDGNDGSSNGNGNGSSSSSSSSNIIDVAYWAKEGLGVLVGVANPGSASAALSMRVDSPGGVNVTRIASQPWGNASWSFDGTTLVSSSGVGPLGTSYVILQ